MKAVHLLTGSHIRLDCHELYESAKYVLVEAGLPNVVFEKRGKLSTTSNEYGQVNAPQAMDMISLGPRWWNRSLHGITNAPIGRENYSQLVRLKDPCMKLM